MNHGIGCHPFRCIVPHERNSRLSLRECTHGELRRLVLLVLFAAGFASTALADPNAKPAEKSHPLDPALKIARDGLEHIKKNVHDYTCTIIKRERVNDT